MRFLSRIQRILIIAFVLETACATYALNLTALVGVLTIIHTIAGITIAFCLLWMKPGDVSIRTNLSFAPTANKYRWLLMAIATFVICRFAVQWMIDDPVDYHTADMLPIIKVMNQRLWSGSWAQVYDPIPEIWHGIKPIYLPAMWMPFGLPEMLQIDVRWITVIVLLIVLAVFLWKIDLKNKNAWPVLLCGFLLYWWLFADEKAGLFTFTEEGVVVFYYVLLTTALLKKNIWLIAVCTSLCVLSRYALVGWLPAMVVYFAYTKEWKKLLRFAVTGLVMCMLFLVLPFGWNVVKSLLLLPGSYIEFTERVWRDAPHVFSESLGLAKFFGPDRITLLHYLLISFSLVIPTVVMLFFLRWGKKWNIPDQNLPLVVLKLSLVIFFSFIDVPYLYLFYTSSFVSLIAVAVFVSRKNGTRI